MVDSLIRTVAEHLGRSSPWHQRFLSLQEVVTATNMELQGIHNIRWLSRGDAVLRLVEVFQSCFPVLPLSTMECERGFSRQNINKSWQRGSLKDARLEDLITMSLLNYEPDYTEVVQIWRSYKERRHFGNVAATPAEEGQGNGTGKEAAVEEWEEVSKE
ncbi:unnamed protein product [Closterium sp. NIES-54]